MKWFRLGCLTALLISIQLVSTSCHGLDINGSATYVNEKDQRQILQFSTGGNDLRSWVAGLKKIPEQGEYVRWDASAVSRRVNPESQDGSDPERVVGIYVRTGSEYLLKNPKEGDPDSHFLIQPDSTLRDENGNLWRRDEVRSVKVKVQKTLHLSSLFHR
jgi:hypothetical protein